MSIEQNFSFSERMRLRIVIEKNNKKLLLYDGDRLIRSFEVVFGFSPVGSKKAEGDGKTPEGEYVVCVKNPKSKFHLSLGLNYPNEADAERGLASGLISKAEHQAISEALKLGKLPPQKTALGGEIYIHGGGTSRDWTRGCVGLDDEDMTKLFEMIKIGTPISVLP